MWINLLENFFFSLFEYGSDFVLICLVFGIIFAGFCMLIVHVSSSHCLQYDNHGLFFLCGSVAFGIHFSMMLRNALLHWVQLLFISVGSSNDNQSMASIRSHALSQSA